MAMLISIVIYAALGEYLSRGGGENPNTNLLYVMTLAAVTLVIVMMVTRRFTVYHAHLILLEEPSNVEAINRWQAGHLITYTCAEVIALLGLVLRVMHFELAQVVPFYVVGFLLLLYFAPKLPAR